MKLIKISLIVLMLLALLLMTGITASAEANRIYFNSTCDPESEVIILDPPHFSGPNLHLTGQVSIHCTAYDMEGNPFPYNTGWAYGTDAHLQQVDGHAIHLYKITFIPDVDDGGYWEGTRVDTPGIIRVTFQGKGTYQGMQMVSVVNPDGTSTNYMTVKD